MLRTNTNQARQNLRSYIIENFTPEDYTNNPPKTFDAIAQFVLDSFRSELFNSERIRRYYEQNEYRAFMDWCAGGASVIDTGYYWSRSAVDDLGAILNESTEERKRFSESQAEEMLTRLIYRELKTGEQAAEKATMKTESKELKEAAE